MLRRRVSPQTASWKKGCPLNEGREGKTQFLDDATGPQARYRGLCSSRTGARAGGSGKTFHIPAKEICKNLLRVEDVTLAGSDVTPMSFAVLCPISQHLLVD